MKRLGWAPGRSGAHEAAGRRANAASRRSASPPPNALCPRPRPAPAGLPRGRARGGVAGCAPCGAPPRGAALERRRVPRAARVAAGGARPRWGRGRAGRRREPPPARAWAGAGSLPGLGPRGHQGGAGGVPRRRAARGVCGGRGGGEGRGGGCPCYRARAMPGLGVGWSEQTTLRCLAGRWGVPLQGAPRSRTLRPPAHGTRAVLPPHAGPRCGRCPSAPLSCHTPPPQTTHSSRDTTTPAVTSTATASIT